jgi:hypothetical protein
MRLVRLGELSMIPQGPDAELYQSVTGAVATIEISSNLPNPQRFEEIGRFVAEGCCGLCHNPAGCKTDRLD